MPMLKHTKGPWWPDFRTGSIACAVGWIVGTFWHDRKGDGEFGDLKADMQLVSAAPVLLAACEGIVAWWECELDDEHDDLLGQIRVARAAIANAQLPDCAKDE